MTKGSHEATPVNKGHDYTPRHQLHV